MGRPKEINWELVERRIEAGCSGIQIAAALRIDSDTFYKRFEQHYGKRFSAISADFYSAGESNILFTQYMKALSGNIPMLTLLGRERCGQGKEEVKQPAHQDAIDLLHKNMLLQAENDNLREQLGANKPKAE